MYLYYRLNGYGDISNFCKKNVIFLISAVSRPALKTIQFPRKWASRAVSHRIK
jgi:hypothetical protein